LSFEFWCEEGNDANGGSSVEYVRLLSSICWIDDEGGFAQVVCRVILIPVFPSSPAMADKVV